jgi:plasmid stabilization system protein ParE
VSVYVLTPLAKADIFDIWSYIADDNEDAADRVNARYTTHAHLLQVPLCAAIPGLTSRPVRFVSGR